MLEVPVQSPLAGHRPGRIAALLGRMLGLAYRLAGRHRYDAFRLERVLGLRLLVMPSVANPRLLRTGAYFAEELDRELERAPVRQGTPAADVLDLGTGSGICALIAARHVGRVVAVDINPAAVRCARVNALVNDLEDRIDFREGDLFDPVANERFDLVLFNPPFLRGAPRDDRDAAWRSVDAADRFAERLSAHLNPGGAALLVLSTFGNACAEFEAALRRHRFRLDVLAQRRFINETVTIVRVRDGFA